MPNVVLKALRKAPLLLLLSTSIVITSGCASKPSFVERERINAATWVSAPIDEYMESHGAYDQQASLKDGRKVYTFRGTCTTTMVTDAEDVIVSTNVRSCNI